MGGDETLWANAWAREARNEAVWIPRVPFGMRNPEPRNGVLKGAEAFALEPKPSNEAVNQRKKKTIESVRSGMNLMAAVGSHWETAAFKLMPRQGEKDVNEQVPRNLRELGALRGLGNNQVKTITCQNPETKIVEE